MKTILVLITLTIASIFSFSETALSWDALITNDTSWIKKNDPTYLGSITINGQMMWRTANKFYNADSKAKDLADDMTLFSFPLRGSYSVNDFVQTFAIIQFLSVDDGVNNDAGMGDLWLGAKWAVRPDGLFTIRGALGLPTGYDKKGLGDRGGYGLDAGFMTGIINGPIKLNGQFGLRYNAESTDTNILPGICVYVDGKAGYHFNDKFNGNVGLEFMNWDDSKTNDIKDPNSQINWLEASLGIGYKWNETIGLFLDGTYDIFGKNTPLSTGFIFGFSYGY